MFPKDLNALRKDIVFDTTLNGRPFTFHSTWGLFSPTEVDEGSRLLIEHLPVKSTDTTLEIGCGYGPIGIAIAAQSPKGSVQMVDKDFVAVEFTKKNCTLNKVSNCSVYLSNAFNNVPDEKFDLIVSNLPAKVGNELLFLIMNDAKAHLKPGGTFYVVVIAGLKEYIKRNFKEIFGNYTKVKQGKTYMVAMATKE